MLCYLMLYNKTELILLPVLSSSSVSVITVILQQCSSRPRCLQISSESQSERRVSGIEERLMTERSLEEQNPGGLQRRTDPPLPLVLCK